MVLMPDRRGASLAYSPFRALALIGCLTASPAIAQNAPATQYEIAAARLERALSAFEYLQTQIDVSAFDVAANAAVLSNDPDRIFEFVRSEVRFEPYFGVLRGAKGTLMGLAGDAADQSVLLVALLREAGIAEDDIRFATGTL